MATPTSVALHAIILWACVIMLTQLPSLPLPARFENFNGRVWLIGFIIPNLLRYIVASAPRLAVNKSFVFMASLISVSLVYLITKIGWPVKKKDVESYGKDKNSTMKTIVLFSMTFIMSALAIQKLFGLRLYTEMGWESPVGNAQVVSVSV
jgi:hypothetical protein